MKSQKFNLIYIIVLMVVVLNATAQKHELGAVTVAELEQKFHPTDKDAEAAILYEKGVTRMEYTEQSGFVIITETEVKIKIYTKEGYKWTNKAVSMYVAQNPKEKVSFSKAITYNLVNGAIEKTKLKSEGEFEEKINKSWSQKKITMPNVKEGSIIEYRYITESPYVTNFPTWNFQTTIPVNHSEYKTFIPEYFTYNINTKGYLSPKVTRDSKRRTMRYTYTTDDVGGMNNSGAQRISDEVEFMENTTLYVLENIPALKDENYVNNIDNYTVSVRHELAVTKYPNSTPRMYSTSWEDVVKNIYLSEGFGGELKKAGYFETDVQPLIAAATSNDDKILSIFKHVQSKMNWNNTFGYNCDEGVKKAYKDNTGNVAEINLMLTAMLRKADINANPVLVSTRSNGISFSPNRTAFNYVITAVETPNGIILLDATDKFSLPNILPIRTLNWTGMLIRKDGTSARVDLMPQTNSKEIINMVATIDASGNLSGMVRDQYFDYNAFLYRVNYNALSQNSYLEKLEKAIPGIEISDYKVTTQEILKPVVESYTFTHNAVADVIGEKIYLSGLLFFSAKENPFKQDTREYPVDFMFPNQDKYAFTLNIPAGYEVEAIPKPIALNTESEIGSFKYNISATGTQIQISSSLDINQSIVNPTDYEELKDFYRQVIEKQNEKIVLKKI